MPDTKRKTTKIGSRVSPGMAATWRQRVQKFLQGGQSTDQGTKRRRRKDPEVYMHSNMLFVRSIDHALQSIGLALAQFKVARPLLVVSPPLRRYFVVSAGLPAAQTADGAPRRSCIHNDETGESYLEIQSGPKPCLFLDLDKGPDSWPSRFYMFSAGGLRGTGTDDMMHSQWNGTRMAIRKSGLHFCFLEVAMVLNMFTAPFGGDTFWGQIVSTMEEYVRDNNSDDPLFRFFAPALSTEGMKRSVDYGSDHQLNDLWRGLQSMPFMLAKPSRMKTTRWFHFIRLGRDLVGYWFGLLFALVVLALDQGWDISAEVFTVLGHSGGTSAAGSARGDGGESQLAHTGAQAAQSGASSSSGARPCGKQHNRPACAGPSGPAAAAAATEAPPERAAPGDKERGTKHGDMTIEKLRQSTLNTVDACIHVLKSNHAFCYSQVILLFGEIVAAMHGRDVIQLSTQMGAMRWHAEMAMQGNNPVLRKIVGEMHGTQLLVKLVPPVDNMDMFFDACGPSEDELAGAVFDYALHLLGIFSLIGLQYQYSLPQKLHLLAHPAGSLELRTGLAFVKLVFEALQSLEQEMAQVPFLKSFHSTLFWAHEHWVREMLVAASEFNFLGLPSWASQSALAYTRRWGCTKLSEDSINVNRDLERGGRKGSAGRVSRWTAAMSQTFMEDNFDVKLARAEGGQASALGRDIPASTFLARGGDLSMDQSFLDGMKSQTWTNPSAEEYRLAPIKLSMMLTASSDWSSIDLAWLSLLACPGTLLKGLGTKDAFMVLESCRWGCVVWPLSPVLGVRNERGFILDPKAEPVVKHILDHTQWVGVEMSARMSTCKLLPVESNPEVSRLAFFPAWKPDSLHRSAARKAFVGMTVPLLQRLMKHVGLQLPPGEKPTLGSLLRCLMRHSLPDLPEDEIEQLVATRDKAKVAYQGCLTESDIAELFEADAIDEEDKNTAVAAFKRMSKVAAATARKKPVVSESTHGDKHCAKDGAETVPDEPNPKKRYTGYSTPADAKLALPQVKGCTIQKDAVRFNRWTVSYPCTAPPFSYSRSWGDGGRISPADCLKACYEWAWARHSAATGEAPQWVFQTDGAENVTRHPACPP